MAKYMYVEKWRCQKCGEAFSDVHPRCFKCRGPYAGTEFAVEKWPKCSKCGKEVSLSFNVCPNCREVLVPCRLAPKTTLYADNLPESVNCCLVHATETVILQAPRAGAERLYVVGTGDLIPMKGETAGFYVVATPVGEGFLPKSTCWVVEVGLGEVGQPLGFSRQIDPKAERSVVAYQADGTPAAIMKASERYPIIGETDSDFIVQHASGIRGCVSKRDFFRTLTKGSVESVETPPSMLGTVFAVGALLALGAVAGSSHDRD